MHNKIIWLIAGLAVVILGYLYLSGSSDKKTEEPAAGKNSMSFFVTSKNPGQGANLGGLAGADLHCQNLAAAAGAGDKTWRAYLSTQATGTVAAVNARDRIGAGPWYNKNGVLVANDVAELHQGNFITKAVAIDENGNTISGRGDSVNTHDILTGSQADGTASTTASDTTCGNWTLGSTTGSAIVGHHDRMGLNESDAAKSWNSSHASRGCGLDQLKATGGGGLLYCFAAD